ncbi:MAG: dicarboxylate/amino acid:cation symporter [Bacteroidales bacterium]|nr:dicarboxylate/amino acid:cation symporter [Bacteroidales bacterium]
MIKRVLKTSLTVNILICFILGIVFGFVALHFQWNDFVILWIYPFGELFLKLLKFIAIPIVFISVIGGVINVGNIRGFKSLAYTSFITFLFTTVLAIMIGLFLVKTFNPGKHMDEEAIASISADDLSSYVDIEQSENRNMDLNSIIEDLVPENFFRAAADNTKVLQIIFVAIFFGLIIISLPQNKTQTVRNFLTELNTIVIKYVEWVMKIAPLGVFALIVGMMVKFGGNLSVAKALGVYILLVASGLAYLIFIQYPIFARIFSGVPILKFFKAIYPAQLLAFSSSSSAVTLPVTQRQVENGLGVSPKVSGFVLPLGATVNMDGTSLYQTIGVLFIAQIFGIDLSFSQLLMFVFIIVLSSIGTPSIPGGSIVVLVFILNSFGIPAEGLVLILGVDRPLDMLRTVANVTGDAFVCTVVDKRQKKIEV